MWPGIVELLVAARNAMHRGEPILWGQDIAHKAPAVDYSKVINDDGGLLVWLTLLDKYGFAFVRGVPPTPEATEQLLKRIGPLHETIFGGFWVFPTQTGPTLEQADTAYTNIALGAHTDSTYFNSPPGLQSLHCIKYEATGGQSLLVDGFNIAKVLKQSSPRAFEFFSRTLIPFHYRDDVNHHDFRTWRRVFETDEQGEVTSFRYNNDDRAVLDMPPEQIDEFYTHLPELMAAIRNPKLEYRFQLEPGTVLTFHNWRLMHGRDSYQGTRILCGAYHTEDDFRSRLRWLRHNIASRAK